MQRTGVRGDCQIQCRNGNVAQKATSGEAGHLGLVRETIPQMI